MADQDPFAGWAILELMGHRRLGGYVSQQEIFGSSFIRIDVPGQEGETTATQLYSPSALYCLTPTSEEIARAVAKGSQPAPVQRWELPAPKRDESEEEELCAECGTALGPNDSGDTCRRCLTEFQSVHMGEDPQ